MKKFKKPLIIFFSILAFLVILNYALEPVVLHYVNKTLSELKGYTGSAKDIDIKLYKGAYHIDTLVIKKTDDKSETPFFKVSGLDISIEWKSLWKGSFVAEIIVDKPVINFIKQGEDVSAGGDNDFVSTVKKLSPATINRLQINNGQVHFIDQTSKPRIDVAVTAIYATATNLTNVDDVKEKLPSSVTLTANTSGNGKISSRARMNVLKDTADFDFNLELQNADLTYFKDFTDAYAAFTFKKGQLYLSVELAMQDGQYSGYIKPVMENIKIIDLTPDTEREKKRPFFKKVWELIVGAGVEIVKNKPKDRLATKIPLKGNVNKAEKFTWTAVINVLKNGFVKAFDKDVEGSIDINDAKAPAAPKE